MKVTLSCVEYLYSCFDTLNIKIRLLFIIFLIAQETKLRMRDRRSRNWSRKTYSYKWGYFGTFSIFAPFSHHLVIFVCMLPFTISQKYDNITGKWREIIDLLKNCVKKNGFFWVEKQIFSFLIRFLSYF